MEQTVYRNYRRITFQEALSKVVAAVAYPELRMMVTQSMPFRWFTIHLQLMLQSTMPSESINATSDTSTQGFMQISVPNLYRMIINKKKFNYSLVSSIPYTKIICERGLFRDGIKIKHNDGKGSISCPSPKKIAVLKDMIWPIQFKSLSR